MKLLAKIYIFLCFILNTTTANAAFGESKINKREYLAAQQKSVANKSINEIRIRALRETALSVGARGGLAERAHEINAMLTHNQWVLARIFKFYGLVLEQNVLPPVLLDASNPLVIAANDVIRVSDKNYKIVQQAKFISAPPTWRDYLWLSYTKPEVPNRSLLPRNKIERQLWRQDLEEGWQAGRQQADTIYSENLNRLVRDYSGMILYHSLLAQNVVTAPFVSSLNMGITGDKHDININDRILRITALPGFNHDGNNWKTEIYLHE